MNAADTLSLILSKLDRHDEAETLQNETLALCEKVLGDEDELTITVMKNLTEILYDGGKVEKALLMIGVAEILAQEIFGEDSHKTKEIIELHEKFLNG